MRFLQVRRGLFSATILSVLLALSACGTFSKKTTDSDGAEASQRMTESLGAADKAQKLGKTDEAIAALDVAVKVDPASKQPWLRKAQIYFDARQYGQAITAAQEVLQRDTTDLTAKSILAVSGLRVSAQALEQLRTANEVNGSARTEAESVAKLIREALGEPILVPPLAADASASAPAKMHARRSAPRQARLASVPSSSTASVSTPALAGGPVVKPATTAIAPASKGNATPAASGRNNPFGALQ